jgi:hypothetical protein
MVRNLPWNYLHIMHKLVSKHAYIDTGIVDHLILNGCCVQGDRYRLLQVDSKFNAALQDFLYKNGHDDIAWIHDLRLGLYADASASATLSAANSNDLFWKKASGASNGCRSSAYKMMFRQC